MAENESFISKVLSSIAKIPQATSALYSSAIDKVTSDSITSYTTKYSAEKIASPALANFKPDQLVTLQNMPETLFAGNTALYNKIQNFNEKADDYKTALFHPYEIAILKNISVASTPIKGLLTGFSKDTKSEALPLLPEFVEKSGVLALRNFTPTELDGLKKVLPEKLDLLINDVKKIKENSNTNIDDATARLKALEALKNKVLASENLKTERFTCEVFEGKDKKLGVHDILSETILLKEALMISDPKPIPRTINNLFGLFRPQKNSDKVLLGSRSLEQLYQKSNEDAYKSYGSQGLKMVLQALAPLAPLVQMVAPLVLLTIPFVNMVASGLALRSAMRIVAFNQIGLDNKIRELATAAKDQGISLKGPDGQLMIDPDAPLGKRKDINIKGLLECEGIKGNESLKRLVKEIAVLEYDRDRARTDVALATTSLVASTVSSVLSLSIVGAPAAAFISFVVAASVSAVSVLRYGDEILGNKLFGTNLSDRLYGEKSTKASTAEIEEFRKEIKPTVTADDRRVAQKALPEAHSQAVSKIIENAGNEYNSAFVAPSRPVPALSAHLAENALSSSPKQTIRNSSPK
jgi:hypothetical protein